MRDLSIVLNAPPELMEALAEQLRPVIREEAREAYRQATLPPYLKIEDVMAWTGWSKRQVYYKLEKRAFPSIKRGRTTLIPTEAFIAYLEKGRIEAKKSKK